jgi:hypothetical protein
MADSKITALTALTAADPVNDMFPVVDVSDTSMAASGTTKKISVNNILGASGTATLASATITGALTVDTTTLVVNAAGYADRVGIGQATPATTLDVNGDITQRNGSGTIIGNIMNSSGLYDVKASANVTGLQLSTAAATPIVFAVNNVEAMRLNSSGNLAFVNGKGIDFSAVTGGTGTATANVLNDYEEGTWTPVATGLTNVGAVTYTATYTKIGRVVYINLKVSAVTSTTSVANTTYFSGLPFNPAQNSTVTAVNEGNITSLGVGLIATGSNLFAPSWTAVQNATLSGFYYV